jgi:hypothetical protein
MNKPQFLRYYRQPQPKITIWFNDQKFIEREGIILSEETVSSIDADDRGFTYKMNDPDTSLITEYRAII